MHGWLRAPARAFAEVMFDRGGGVPADRLDWTERELDAMLAAAGGRTRLAFGAVMIALELLPALFSGGPSRFSRLAPPARLAYLERIDASGLAILLALPKALLGLTYYEHPDALAETGYDGGCLRGESPAAPLVALGARRAAGGEVQP
jgi:hypothetical protein